MNLKVNYEELNHFCNSSKNENDIFKDKISIWINKIEEMKEIWQGEDADEFYENITNYFKKLSLVPLFFDSIGNFVSEASNRYRNDDLESKNEFNKIDDTEGDPNVQSYN